MEPDIRTTAYFLWEARGRAHGHDQGDWFAAQTLLRRQDGLAPPRFARVDAAAVLKTLDRSRRDLSRALDSFSWIELAAHPQAIFDADRNRRLFFEDGFLNTCQGLLQKAQGVGGARKPQAFYYPDPDKYRGVVRLLGQGVRLPPPLFLYPAPFELEILDGVHRCLAALELARSQATAGSLGRDGLTLRVGFDPRRFAASSIAHEIWIRSLLYAEPPP